MASQCISQVCLLMVTISISCMWLWRVQSAHGQGVYIHLNGVNYSNNSEVNITDIGIGDDYSLLCYTDNTNCCRESDTPEGIRGIGDWHFPNNTVVGIKGPGSGGDFYRNRGESVVRLHRKESAVCPIGPFCCEVPDSTGAMTRMCIIVASTSEELCLPNVPTTTLQEILDSTQMDLSTSVKQATTSTSTESSSGFSYATNTMLTEVTASSPVTIATDITPFSNQPVTPTDCSLTAPTSSPGTGLYLNGARYINNSIIILEDISEGNCALLCYTDLTNCCEQPGQRSGEWYFPNKTHVTIRDDGTRGFYRDRAPSVVRLNRINDAMMPTGLFCCKIPVKESDSDETFCTGIYDRESGIEINFIINDAVLYCNTNLSLIVDSIELLDVDGDRIHDSVINKSTLSYVINTTPTNATYTCRVNSTLGSQNVSLYVFIDDQEIEETTVQSIATTLVFTEQNSILTPNIPLIPTAASIAIILTLLLIILILACIILLRRKRTQRKQKNGTLNTALDLKDHNAKTKPEKLELEEVTENSIANNLNRYQREDKPIPLAQFVEHVDQMHANRDDLFEDEFSSLCTTPQAAHDVSSIPYNDEKNRFLNIFPYDYNRVKLKEIPDVEGSDYINASYLNGYYKQKAYIAAQGPLPNSLEDFWRMIWEQKLPTIVMLTKCFEERKKCECYWPESKEKTLTPGHELTIKLTNSIPFSDFIIRKMTVKSGLEPDTPPLEVTQLHFTAWPDHGVPSNTSVMLNIIRRVRKIHPYSDPQPLLVHCSAGVGRTGTFIVLDSMLERMKSEKSLNIFEFVQQLREERVFMVQSLAQYMFIHDALKELILCGETEILAPNLGIAINKLSKIKDDCSGFELQFQTLKKLHPKLENDSFSSAMTECNLKKNRYPDKIPCDGSSRVTLRWSGEQGSDYINASFIDGYKQRRAYIATQGPLESTVDDFWRMIWEQKSCCIVMLCQLEENDKEMSSHYWPTEDEPQTYGKLMVKKLSHEKRGDIIVRRFEIDEKKQSSLLDLKTAITVTQFQFLVWKEDETPPIASHLIELVDNANKIQMGSGNRPMVVVCNDGVGRTGTFICIHAQLERLKTEGVVDFFQFVKSARIQRPGLILSVGQYELCHSTVLQYLQSVDAYANFKDVV